MLNACLDCGRPSRGKRCPRHEEQHRVARRNRRPRGNAPNVRKAVLRRDDFTCQSCGRRDPTGEHLRVDHRVRRIDGGSDDPSNLRTLCTFCHPPN